MKELDIKCQSRIKKRNLRIGLHAAFLVQSFKGYTSILNLDTQLSLQFK